MNSLNQVEQSSRSSLVEDRRITRTMIDLTLENLSALEPLERDVLELHKRDILQWLQELLHLDKEIMKETPSVEMRSCLTDSFTYKTRVNKSLSELDASLPGSEIHSPLPSTPSALAFPAQSGIELAKPKITCPTFTGLDKTNKFALRDFLTRFEFCTSGVSSKKEKLICLKAYVIGRPFHLIHHLSENDYNFDVAINILKAEYWDREAIREEIFKRIVQHTPKMDKSYEQLKEYLSQVQYELGELDSDYGYDFLVENSGSGCLVAHILFDKIPNEIKAELIRGSNTPYPDLNCILQYSHEVIKALLRIRPIVAPRSEPIPRFRPKSNALWTRNPPKNSALESFHADLDLEDKIPYCNFCARNGHTSIQCTAYPSYNERLDRCRQLGLCKFCTVASHDQKTCPGVKGFRFPCKYCKSQRHHTSMCPQLVLEETEINTSISTKLGDIQNILPMVNITIRRGNFSVSLNCLIDSGSQRSYFSEKVLQHLKCDPRTLEEVTMDVVTFVGRKRRIFKQVTAVVEVLPEVAPQLPILIDSELNLSHKVPDLPMVWDNLRKLNYTFAAEIESGSVQLWGLMGIDLIQYMHPVQVIRCMNGTAWQTSTGVIPIGNTKHFLYENEINKIDTNSRASNCEIDRQYYCNDSWVNSIMNPVPTYVDPFADIFEESTVDRGLEWMFSLESLGLPDIESVSDYDTQKMEEFTQNIVYEDGHYLVKLPWHKDKLPQVQSNYNIALKVLDRVVLNLRKKHLYEEYVRVFEDQEKAGIIEPLQCTPEEYKNYVWVPHRPVFKEEATSTTKIRPVFNCSFKTKNSVSLNDAAYAGINLTGDMLNLTLLFRTNKYVFLADIKKAFLMIRLAYESDKNKFCFFLRKNNKIRCYRYTTIIFGFSASPFILSCILKYHAGRYPLDDCTRMLHSNFYVDNLIRTSNSSDELTGLYTQAVERLQEGGFILQSCNSNNTELHELMRGDGTLVSHSCPWEKVLGYRYDPLTDTINIAPYNCNPEAATKRRILSEASRIFDPLSLCLPVSIQARILISELWKLGFEWDEIVPSELQSKWAVIAHELSELGSVTFPRKTLDEGKEAELFLFCDASKKAYGFAAYAVQGKDSSLVFSKAKVAPLKSKSLPTLELLSAFLAIKCLRTLLRALSNVSFKKIFLAVDSQIVLSWLVTKQTNSRNVFATNRLKDIGQWEAELMSEFGVAIQFKYVTTTENPADLITRGIPTSKLKSKLKYWLSGPSWMRDHPIAWPESALNCLSPQSKRIVSSMVCAVSHSQEEPVVQYDKYSSLSKLLNVTACVVKFIDKLKKRDSDSVKTARTHLIKVMQRQSLSEELEYLQIPSGRSMPQRVGSLNLFLDKEGLIRSKGRIGKVAVYEYEIVNPLLLAKDHPLTRLIVLNCHDQCKHLGVPATLNKVRLSGYWIPQGRQAVKKVLSGCSLCQKFNSIPFTYPKMTNLPKHRVNMIRPFLHTGVDYTGHLWVLRGEERVKMYILVFTCLEVRSVHLELIEDMSVHSFLMALIRFSNIYGIPSHIYSDNAKSFVAGCDMIHEVLTSSEFLEKLGTCEIKHIKIPLHSPWYGSVWERLIKTIKSCLYKLIGRASYNYFDLLTILSDVQNAVNDRPLTYRSSSDSSLEIISPNHFLHPLVNPHLILRMDRESIHHLEPPSRRQLLESLNCRDEALKRFKKIWYQDYLLSIREHVQRQQRGTTSVIRVGDVVTIKLPGKPRPFWALGRVTHLFTGDDGLVRSAQIRRGDGSLQVHSLKHLYPLELSIQEPSDCIDSLTENTDNSLNGCTSIRDDDLIGEGRELVWICPDCGETDNGSAMVCCDCCDNWYHFSCVGLYQPPPAEEGWCCEDCLNQDPSLSHNDMLANDSLSDTEHACICPGCVLPNDGSPMICCDDCNAWYHFNCVGIQQVPPEDENWYCCNCLTLRD